MVLDGRRRAEPDRVADLANRRGIGVLAGVGAKELEDLALTPLDRLCHVNLQAFYGGRNVPRIRRQRKRMFSPLAPIAAGRVFQRFFNGLVSSM